MKSCYKSKTLQLIMNIITCSSILILTITHISALPNYAKDIHGDQDVENNVENLRRLAAKFSERRDVPKTFPPIDLKGLKERRSEKDRSISEKQLQKVIRTFPPRDQNSKRNLDDRTYFENDAGDQFKKGAPSPPRVQNSKRTHNDRTYIEIDNEKHLKKVVKTFPPIDRQMKRIVELELPQQEENVMQQIEETNEKADLNLYQSDIMIAPDREEEREMSFDEKISKRNAIRDKSYLWPNRKVPYVITSSIGKTGERYEAIMAAIKIIESKTCVRFIERTTEENYLSFVKLSGCWSYVGRIYYQPGAQNVSLGIGCQYTGTVVHELLHAVGFNHEQARSDRDKFIEILWENVKDGKELNFKKIKTDHSNNYVDYDYGSIMHYGSHYFSKNGKPTLKAIGQAGVTTFGQRNEMSVLDATEVNALYHCVDATSSASGWSEWSSFGPCFTSCYKRRQRFCTGVTEDKDCNGADSYGVISDYAVCTPEECNSPQDGHWGMWQAWGSCSADCDEGTRSRKRECTDPAPANGGKPCPASDTGTETCMKKSCNAGPYDTTFDDNSWTDIWHLQLEEGKGWYHKAGKTPSSWTGPSGDHTTGTESYVYFESSSPATKDDQRSVYSNALPPNGGKRCLSFWYHMYGEGMGSLKVYTYAPFKEIVSISGDQGNQWVHVQKTIDAEYELQVIFYAIRGGDYRGDIGLDDIVIKESACSSQT